MQRILIVPALLTTLGWAAAPGYAQDGKAGKTDSAKAAQESGKPSKAVDAGADVSFLKDLTLRSASGESFSFATWFKGKDAKDADKSLYVLTFWSTDCPWVMQWNPDLGQLYQEYNGKGVQFVAIDSNAGEVADASKVSKVAKEQKVPFPVLLDEGNKVADWFGAKTTPQVYLIDGKGRVIYTGAIDNDAKDELAGAERKNYLKDAIDAAQAGKAPATTSTPATGCSIKRAKSAQP
ncbi:MAG: redoxin domain-containing protein [Planctomycetota bacterium]|nr:MAG: redoxin domain-containing protein [Planctomycetota bacterium]